jgi:hypothetical protein
MSHPPAVVEHLQELAAGLRELHRALLDEQRAEYEQAHGPVGGPPQLFQLVLHDPAFAWLRVLSEFMADLEALLDEKEPPSTLEATAIRQELEQVLSAASSPMFWDRCLPLLQVPPVAMAYGRVRSALARLPATPRPGGAAEARADHRWAATRGKRQR